MLVIYVDPYRAMPVFQLGASPNYVTTLSNGLRLKIFLFRVVSFVLVTVINQESTITDGLGALPYSLSRQQHNLVRWIFNEKDESNP